MSSVQTFDVTGWTIDMALEAKGSTTVSMCIPCRNEVATIGSLVRHIRTHLVDRCGLIDELIVLDDRSTDDTAVVAARAGATVVPIDQIHAQHGVGHGKGNALWATLAASQGDLLVWCDGDVTSFEPVWVPRLLLPLLRHDELALVKATYHRPEQYGGGGRTTELVARPLLSLFFPELTGLDQPLAGEFAGRRSYLEQIPFVEGWGAEIGMLIDLARTFGPQCIGQVDLDTRRHRHRSLLELSVQAAEVMATALARTPAAAAFASDELVLTRGDGTSVPVHLDERPPLAQARVRASDLRGATPPSPPPAGWPDR
jgi:glucosyl-3-phosphoglycerate synthase